MDKYLLELSDNEEIVVTENELLEMEKEALEFDGFFPWRIVKKIASILIVMFSCYSYSQRVFVQPNKENDTLVFKIQNDEMYRLLIIQDSVTKFQKDFKGIKHFKIYSKGYLYTKQVDDNNNIVALFFTQMNKFSKRELRRFARQEEYYQVRDLIQDYLDDFQDRDINDFQDDRDSIIDDRDNERQ